MPHTSLLKPSGERVLLRRPLYGDSRTIVPAEEQRENTRPAHLSDASSAPQLTWLVLKDGTSYLVRDYWVEFGKLQCVTLDWERKLLPLARLDLGETVRINQERNVEFVIRSQASSQP